MVLGVSEENNIKFPFQLHHLHLHSGFTAPDSLITSFFTPSLRHLTSTFEDKNGIVSSSLHLSTSLHSMTMNAEDIKLTDLPTFPPVPSLMLNVPLSWLSHSVSIIAYLPAAPSIKNLQLRLVLGYLRNAPTGLFQPFLDALIFMMKLHSLEKLGKLEITHSGWIVEESQKLRADDWKKRGIRTTFIMELEDLPEVVQG